jgi:hypothetical protein
MRLSIRELCSLIENCTNNGKIEITPECERKILNRKFHTGQIKTIIKEKRIAGVIDNEDSSFRVFFEKDNKYDTVIPMRITEEQKIKPITAFKEERKRRIKSIE